ncbi:MAG: hypothetical protein ACT4P6_21485 [Gemmatimonadaceae bacterium]
MVPTTRAHKTWPNAVRKGFLLVGRLTSGALLAATLSVCTGSDTGLDPLGAADGRAAASLQIVLPRSALELGDSMELLAVVLDAAGVPIDGRSAAWESADPAVVHMSRVGVVTGVGIGQATLSARVDRLVATVELEIYAPVGQTTAPELPRRLLDTRYAAPSGVVRHVRAGDNLQQVIDDAERGDVIALEPGSTFTGNYVLRAKPGAGWITIRSGADDSALPPEGTRVRPSHKSAMATLQTAKNASVITTAPGATHYRLIGLEITARPDVETLYALVQFGDGSSAQRTLESAPSDLILDRSYVHGHNTLDLLRCLTLNSAASAVIDSHLSDCHAKGFDSQAIIGWNGPGPFKIANNYLEGAGENVMFGGADSNLPELMPADIEIRGNHFYKPTQWKDHWTVKNLLELKVGRRVLVEGNVFEHSWVDGQTGFALAFKSVNQGGRAPWSQTSDVTFRYNLVRRSAAGVGIAGKPEKNPAIAANKFLFEHNVFAEIGSFVGTQNGRMVQLSNDIRDLEIRHNTMLHNAEAGQFILFTDAGPARGFVVRDNIATKGGPWGAVMGTAPQGVQALATFARTYTFARNVVVGLPSNLVGLYPPDNFYVASLDAIGFADVLNGDFSLTPSSQYFGAGTGASNPGADWARVLQQITGVVLPHQ